MILRLLDGLCCCPAGTILNVVPEKDARRLVAADIAENAAADVDAKPSKSQLICYGVSAFGHRPGNICFASADLASRLIEGELAISVTRYHRPDRDEDL